MSCSARWRVVAAATAALLPLPALSALGPRYGGAVRVGVVDTPAPEPRVPRSSAQRLVAALAHETLVRTGPGGETWPSLAESWTSAASGREWRLRLHEARFHDGTALDAEAAAASLRRFLRSGSPAAARLAAALEGGAEFRAGRGNDLPGVAAPAPRTLLLRFTHAPAVPLAALASPAAAVTGAQGAGSGPFVPSGAQPGRRASFVAAATHVRGRPFLDRVDLVPVADRALAGAELQSGRIDLAPAEAEGPLAATLLLVVDTRRPPFDRPQARAALAAAVDREDLVRHLVPGGEPGLFLLPPSLLAPLGAAPGARTATLSGSVVLAVSREVPSLLSQRVVAHLADLGLRVQAQPREPERVLEGPPAALRLLSWSPEVAEPGLALRELLGLAAPLPAAEALLEAAEREPDADRRRVLLYRAEAALRTAEQLVPLAALPVAFRSARGLHGVRVDGGGRLLLEDAWWQP